ncbi:MAG: hypothetical protein NTY86_23205 [Deltaproteobacteria bacterium]|nr:hypothetical protein [Deltaproteobacteria bacterium]
MVKKKGAPSKCVEWYVQVLRLTAFLSPENMIESANWWNDVIGEPPDTKTLKPKIGGSQENGLFEGGRLILEVAPNRVDWILTALQDEVLSSEAIPTIGPFYSKLDKFLPIVERWSQLDTCPSLSRLAFGATLLCPVENRYIGYTTLSPYLRNVVIDPEGSSDFVYQINRPRNSKGEIPGLRINRLSKWAVLALKIAMIAPQGSFSVVKSKENMACHLELDINTSVEYNGTINQKAIKNVFQELVDLGKEIAEKGDIP